MLLLALLACGFSPDRYAAAAIENVCTYGAYCYPSTYGVYDDLDQCVSAHEPYLLPYHACSEQFCATFDPDAAQECVTLPDPIDCNALAPEACARVWTDCDDVALAACQAAAVE